MLPAVSPSRDPLPCVDICNPNKASKPEQRMGDRACGLRNASSSLLWQGDWSSHHLSLHCPINLQSASLCGLTAAIPPARGYETSVHFPSNLYIPLFLKAFMLAQISESWCLDSDRSWSLRLGRKEFWCCLKMILLELTIIYLPAKARDFKSCY